MSDRLLALKVFIRVARLRSFSRAARELGLSQPSVSRITAELERQVGTALVTRTTRAVGLTDAGSDYLARVEPLLDGLEEADHAARGTNELRGAIRVGASSSFAVREIIPSLPAFMRQHPSLKIDFAIDDHYQNLVVEGIDVALRFGSLSDSSATARLLDVQSRLLLASPDYLAGSGRLETPAELETHSVIVGPRERAARSWTFEKQGRTTSVRIDGRLTASSNEAAVAAAVAGLGVVSTVLWGCRAELEKGTLISLLPGWERDRVELHAVFQAGRAAKVAARAFVDHLATHLTARRNEFLASRPSGL